MGNTIKSGQLKVNDQKSRHLNVLRGTEETVNLWMDFKNLQYGQKSACQELSSRKSCGDVQTLIIKLYKQIDTNCTNLKREKDPSKKNWQLRKALYVAERNKSKEKRLEKNIARLPGKDWFNQIPTASGLTGSSSLKKASIDLVHKISPKCYELIELKWEVNANTPLFAAIEILLYGLLYIHARTHQEKMKYTSIGNELLAADEIRLRVLAPTEYYRGYDLGWFGRELSNGIATFVKETIPSLKIDFAFTAFPEGFQCDGEETILRAALNGVVEHYKW